MRESVQKMDGVAKVTGELRFTSDLYLPSMLYAVPVLSDQAHSKILSIDATEALAVPGCVKVYMGSDVPNNRVGYYHDHPVICDDKVRFYGDIVAVVAAETLESANQAARLVKVAYEPLQLIETVEQALSMERGKVHDQMENNICHSIRYENGDVDAAFGKCAHIVEQDYVFQAVDHCFLETECGISSLENGKLVIRAGSQNVFYDRSQIAEGLGLPEEQVVVIAPYTGGAFGGKGDISVQCLIGLVTLDTGRPCKMHFTREQRFINGVKRHPGKICMKTGTDTEGNILAHTVYTLLDTGAYTVFGNVVLEITTECCAGPYRIPNIRVEAYSLYTNNGVNGAFRGFGAAQGCFSLEGQMNALAKKLNMDPIEFRLRNCVRKNDMSGMGHKLLSDPRMFETLSAAKEDALWRQRDAYSHENEDFAEGVGFACGMKGYSIGINGAQDYGFAQAAITNGGEVKLTIGCIDMGQGSFTAMGSILAETMKIPYESISFTGLSDTEKNEETGATASSRITYTVGRAVIQAGNDLVAALSEMVQQQMHVCAHEIEHVEGGFHIHGELIPFAKIAGACDVDVVRSARIRSPYSECETHGGLGHPHVLYSSNAQIAHVVIDKATGMAHVDEMHVYVDVGKCINPIAVEGQSEGGVVMGISYALLEKVDRKACRPVNTSFSTYTIPTTLDVPTKIQNTILEFEEPTGPLGAKGMAENATVPTAPAVVDAINVALHTDIAELPVSPERIVAITNSAKASFININPK